jgi:peptidoglycan L-alanyl-D-glutamate endopeptidase CwlK
MRPELVVDSQMASSDALRNNPESPAPEELLGDMQVLAVTYLGFDGKTHQGQMVVHKDVSEDVQGLFTLAQEVQFPIEKVIPIANPIYAWDDAVSCDDNNSSGFNYRHISGDPNRLSNHAKGRAFDLNPVQNIYIRYDKDLKEVFRAPATGVYDPTIPGTLHATHPLVLFLKERGWEWGGDWAPESGRVDYQHFEKPER